jgi:hypothetical protein
MSKTSQMMIRRDEDAQHAMDLLVKDGIDARRG